MSKLYVCIGKKATTPYSIPPENLRVSTIEELCYYICDRAEMLDDRIMQDRLADFITQELALPSLGERLAQMLKAGEPLHALCREILDYAGYPDVERRERVVRSIRENEALPVIRRLQKQGDGYTQQKQYYMAQKVYRNMLLRDDVQKDPVLQAEIYERLGNVAALMFQYETAAYCFEKSCHFEEKRRVRQKYLLCQRFLRSREQYLAWVAEREEYYELSVDVERAYDSARQQAMRKAAENENQPELDQMKEEFRRMVLE